MGKDNPSQEEMESMVADITKRVLTKMSKAGSIRPVGYDCSGASFTCNGIYDCIPPVFCRSTFNCPGTFSG
jgi:hypothetical protein